MEFLGEYQITNVHSQYSFEPTQLPSSKLTIKLDDLNANENRNLLFQLNVPKVTNVVKTKPRKFVKSTRPSPNPSPPKLELIIQQRPKNNIEKSEDHIIGSFHRNISLSGLIFIFDRFRIC